MTTLGAALAVLPQNLVGHFYSSSSCFIFGALGVNEISQQIPLFRNDSKKCYLSDYLLSVQIMNGSGQFMGSNQEDGLDNWDTVRTPLFLNCAIVIPPGPQLISKIDYQPNFDSWFNGVPFDDETADNVEGITTGNEVIYKRGVVVLPGQVQELHHVRKAMQSPVKIPKAAAITLNITPRTMVTGNGYKNGFKSAIIGYFHYSISSTRPHINNFILSGEGTSGDAEDNIINFDFSSNID